MQSNIVDESLMCAHVIEISAIVYARIQLVFEWL